MATPLPGSGPEASGLCLLAVALSTMLALLPWLGFDLAASAL